MIAPDGLGGAFVVWEGEEGVDAPSFIQHLGPTGTAAPGWPTFGLRVSSTTSQLNTRVCHDGFGGAIVVWRGPGPDRRQGAFAKRYGPDGPTPTLVSLVSVEAEPQRVVLIWHGAGFEQLPVVQRRVDNGAWEDLGQPDQESSDRLRYEDRAVTSGGRYAYRLRYAAEGVDQFTSETWVNVPAHALTLAGFGPNPALGVPTVHFSLAGDGPATLEVLDIAGRRLASREVGPLGAGRHAIRLDREPRLSPGIYLVRLRTAASTLITRAAVLR